MSERYITVRLAVSPTSVCLYSAATLTQPFNLVFPLRMVPGTYKPYPIEHTMTNHVLFSPIISNKPTLCKDEIRGIKTMFRTSKERTIIELLKAIDDN